MNFSLNIVKNRFKYEDEIDEFSFIFIFEHAKYDMSKKILCGDFVQNIIQGFSEKTYLCTGD